MEKAYVSLTKFVLSRCVNSPKYLVARLLMVLNFCVKTG